MERLPIYVWSEKSIIQTVLQKTPDLSNTEKLKYPQSTGVVNGTK